MTASHRLTLGSVEFVKQCSRVAREKFDTKVVGSEMMKHGYSLLYDVPLDEADRAIRSMLTLYDGVRN